jgi:hypothetical protein
VGNTSPRDRRGSFIPIGAAIGLTLGFIGGAFLGSAVVGAAVCLALGIAVGAYLDRRM